MYGLVNQAIEELVVETAGRVTWERIRGLAGCQEPSFVSMHSYPDELTYALVAKASEVLGVEVETLMHDFGRHWILFTAKEGYGSLLDMAGTSVPEFLRNLDALHARLGMSMPELRPPSFAVEEDDEAGYLILRYYSERKGLEPMVTGLLEGLGLRFGVDVKVESEARSDHEEFRLQVCHASSD